jgi:hypothetical protein
VSSSSVTKPRKRKELNICAVDVMLDCVQFPSSSSSHRKSI